MPPDDAKTAKSETLKPARRELPDWLIVVCIAVGLLLTGVGYFLPGSGPAAGRLLLVMGLGLLCGALGSQATINAKYWSMSGGAAIGLILGWFLTEQVRSDYAVIQLRGLPENSQVSFEGSKQFYSAESGKIREFVAMRDHIKSRSIEAEIEHPDHDVPFIFGCVSSKIIGDKMGAENPVQIRFHFDPEQKTALLVSDDNTIIGEVGPCPLKPPGEESTDDSSSLSGSSLFATMSDGLIGSAWAQDNGKKVQRLLRDLQSRSSSTRRNARNQLAARGHENLPALVAALDELGANYRTKLGVLVAMSGMLAQNRNSASLISAALTDSALTEVVRLAGHRDQTIRSYASQILNGLNDQRIPELIAETLPLADQSAQPALLQLLKESLATSKSPRTGNVAKKLSETQIRKKSSTLRVLSDQITDLAEGKTSATDKYFVVAGAFSSPRNAKRLAGQINAANTGHTARVTKRRPGDPLYRVVVGNYQPRSEADKIKSALLQVGVVKDAFLSSFPDTML